MVSGEFRDTDDKQTDLLNLTDLCNTRARAFFFFFPPFQYQALLTQVLIMTIVHQGVANLLTYKQNSHSYHIVHFTIIHLFVWAHLIFIFFNVTVPFI